jgi:L-fuconolactonase
VSIVIREDWLAQVTEEILEPDRRIVDAHHHFFATSTEYARYGLADLWGDTDSHHVEQTIYLECGEGHRLEGPAPLRPVGETAWVDRIAAQARLRPQAAQIGAIIGTAELRLGPRVHEVLDAHMEASPLFRGIRQTAAWDPCPQVVSGKGLADANLYADPAFRAGFALLAGIGLVFDAWHYHTQSPGLAALARAFPETSIVLDHFGTPIGVGPYAGRQDEVFTRWAGDLEEVATCPNVTVKLGGLALPWTGFGFERRARPPTSDELVSQQARYYHHAIATFGPDRCMFESNFPVDKCAVSYAVLWNAFKKIAAPYTETEKDALFRGTATRVYRLQARERP